MRTFKPGSSFSAMGKALGTAKERALSDDALWRELAVLFCLCGFGW